MDIENESPHTLKKKQISASLIFLVCRGLLNTKSAKYFCFYYFLHFPVLLNSYSSNAKNFAKDQPEIYKLIAQKQWKIYIDENNTNFKTHNSYGAVALTLVLKNSNTCSLFSLHSVNACWYPSTLNEPLVCDASTFFSMLSKAKRKIAFGSPAVIGRLFKCITPFWSKAQLIAHTMYFKSMLASKSAKLAAFIAHAKIYNNKWLNKVKS